MENKYRCDVCKDSGAVKTGEFEYSECPCLSDNRDFIDKTVGSFTGNCADNIHWYVGRYSQGFWSYNSCSYCGKRQ